jgi:hypothetical protein
VGEFCERSCVHGTSDGHSCTCEGNWIGELCDTECGCGAHGIQTDIEAARAANSCSAGTCTCEGNWVGDLCDTECGCGEHGTQTGIEAARAANSCSAGTCTCEGDFVGEHCDTECGCSGHGTQTGIETARLATAIEAGVYGRIQVQGNCGAGSCACDRDYGGDFCEIWYRPSYTLSGCPDPSFCGVFERTNTTCHGLPAYQQQLGGLALYQIAHHGGSVWYVGPSARLEDCDSLAQSPTRFRYMWSEMTSTQQAPDHHSYAGWKRCTSHGNGGQCLSFEPASITIA